MATKSLAPSNQPTMKRVADLDGPDFFPTPRFAVHALIESEPFEGLIWEPACGDGAMAEVLKLTGNHVIASDLYDRGYGQGGVDFTQEDRRVPNIITNPPFHSAEAFVRAAHRQAEKKFALLLRLAFLEGAHRAEHLFAPIPPARVWVFSERITFYPKGAEVKGSGTMSYMWALWDKAHTSPTELKWLKPGFKAKYSKK